MRLQAFSPDCNIYAPLFLALLPYPHLHTEHQMRQTLNDRIDSREE